MSEKQVIVVTTPTVPGYEILKVLGTVHGLTVRTRGVGGKIVAGIEGIFGGRSDVVHFRSRKGAKRLTEEIS